MSRDAHAVDPYVVKIEQARAAITELTRFDQRAIHTQNLCAFLVSAPPRNPATGDLDCSTTWAVNLDEEVGAVMLFAGFMAIRSRHPMLIGRFLARLESEGMLSRAKEAGHA